MLSEDNLLKNTGQMWEGARTGAQVSKLSETGPLTQILVILKHELTDSGLLGIYPKNLLFY